MADADLDYLVKADFWTIGNGLFEELKIQGVVSNERQWNELQVKFLEQHRYFTKTANDTRSEKKAERLAMIKRKLVQQ